jgi:hypothetical protein
MSSIYTWKAINTNSSGDSVIIPGIAGKIIRVIRIWFTIDQDTLISFKDGSTPFDGPLNFVDCRSLTFNIDTEPWFITSPGNDFIINQTGTAQISGKIDFEQ